MSTTLFPMIQPRTVIETDASLPLYQEVKWDYEKNIPVFKNGSPVIVSGAEAVFVWAWKALNTVRYRHEIYTWDYGFEGESLIGQPFTEELKHSEAARYVKESLMINPYITNVRDISTLFSNDILSIKCTIDTVYGEVKMDV